MDLVVGASESTVKSLLGKLGVLLAQEYTLIRGVHGDLRYINDELASMQSFLRDLGGTGDSRIQDHRTKDWMKQIRDLTYDIEDCVDNSGHRLRGMSRGMTCYFLINSIYEVVTWWPRRDIATTISDLKMRAQQIGERRHRYGVDNPKTGHSGSTGAGTGGGSAGFSAAENQDLSLKLVAANDPVGVDMDMKVLEDWVTMQGEANKVTDVLAVVGFGGVGKTTIATDLYNKFRDQFEHRATVTVSQSSDLEAILTNIKSQVMPRSDDHQQGHLPGKKGRLAAIRGLVRKVQQRTSGVIAKCSVGGDSDEMEDSAKLSQLKKDLINILNEKRSMVFKFNTYLLSTQGIQTPLLKGLC
ncbi:hypothetical protein HU200_065235 [Digitaria exilis]|uniref:Uncharacterized protein n=1 Tax=Digitaria exilis TaxID=1010633 RepID=A0A835DXZ7_9POAL|nr:hypothetical protein HU200_065235 [Digitaria exilis]